MGEITLSTISKGGLHMKPFGLIGSLFWTVVLMCSAVLTQAQEASPMPGDPLTGNGDVDRSVLTYASLFSSNYGSSPVNDMNGFGLPANAAQPTESFEGTLTLSNLSNNGFKELVDIYKLIFHRDSPWKHLPAFSFQFVQNGSYIIPAQQGLIYTGHPDWNYIIGPGRVWIENSDHGYMRAALPFSLVQRNQNCVHNGELTFLFSNTSSPNVSNVYYQITQETCYPMKFDEWGTLTATYSPGTVANDTAIENAAAAEVGNRMPTKPFSELATDFPNSGIVLSNFTHQYSCSRREPACVTTYGLVINGTNYSSGNNCATRWGNYAFCDEMRLPSYSTAKTAFANVALARLGQMYSTGMYELLIENVIVPDGGNWSLTTLNDAVDMASGNYNLNGFESDEGSTKMSHFLEAEAYSTKIDDAFVFVRHYVTPDTLWIYHSSDTFLATSAMNLYLQQMQRSTSADIFDQVLNDVYIPLNTSQGFGSMLRTNDSPSGHPTGYYGLFYLQDDIAKIGDWLNNGHGVINNEQVLEPTRLTASLFRNPNVTGLSVPVPNDINFFYKNATWGKMMTPAQFPQYSCTFHVAYMSGFGGITVLMLPDGVTYYVFTDNNQFYWYDAVNEINKIAPFCVQPLNALGIQAPPGVQAPVAQGKHYNGDLYASDHAPFSKCAAASKRRRHKGADEECE
jgi:hypothetical protein